MKKFRIDLLSEKCFGLGHYTNCNVEDCDGRVYLPYGSEGSEKGTGYALYSSDGGRTFDKAEASPKSELFKKLSDGTFVAFASSSPTLRLYFNRDFGDMQFLLTTYRADSFEDVLAGRVSTHMSLIDIPKLTWGYGDSGNFGIGGCVTGWTELSNGDILMTMYGHTKDDTTLCPYFVEWGKYNFYLYSTWCLVSHDKGQSFEFLARIADCQSFPIADINAEGYCEPDVIEVEDGHLLAIIRTGGHNIKSPLYACHSYDYGRTWEAPYEIYEWGVLPRILRMKSGRIAVCTGHPDVFLLVSDDGGRTWSDKVTVQDDPGDWGMTTSGYSSIFECEDGVITVIYDASFEAKKDLPEDAPLHRYVYQKTFRLIEE